MIKKEIIQIRVAPEVKQSFKVLAEKKGYTLSEYLRYLMMQKIEEA